MKEVMQKAQELAEAILNSEIYQDMKKQENVSKSLTATQFRFTVSEGFS
jgi:cell fate (sporulation/competence/biofilm development) regulator YlbF (YheA/YmcA/DUF963 family)